MLGKKVLAAVKMPRLRGSFGLLPLVITLLILVPILAAGCSDRTLTATNISAGNIIQVVAAESFWGSIAAQLGGSHVNVTSIISDPNIDPHEYESDAADARSFAHANYVILNGAGYDSWGQKLLDANPVSSRKVLNVADLLGKTEGDNPHFWYDPDYVNQVIAQITKDYQAIDPGSSQFFTRQQADFENNLSGYHQLISSIKQTYSGVKVGATESIFVYMAGALGLDLISPPAFMNAISQGNAPPAASVAQSQQQISQHEIVFLAYNKQTVSTITTNIEKLAKDNGVSTVGITETIVPAGTSFQDWQVAQLKEIQAALSHGH